MVGYNFSNPACFSHCKALSYLNLSKNPIESIKPLSELLLLRELDLSGFHLENLDEIAVLQRD